ncbi:MAG: hypothetical protein V3U65_12040 [Granulosicoccaceae bacterium]
MAGIFAKTITGLTWRCIAVACAFALLIYGQWVLSDTRMFGLYAALCLFAVAIVFYQTRALADRKRNVDSAMQLDQSSAYRYIKQLSLELVTLEEEYKTDVLRLEGTWL